MPRLRPADQKTPRRLPLAPTPFAYRIPVAAQMIGIAPSTLWAKIKSGEIEARKIGSATVIRHAELETFMERTSLRTKSAH